MTEEQTYTTAEIEQVFQFGDGEGRARWGFRAITDRRIASKGGFTKGKPGPWLVEDELPALLRTVANFMEQEDALTLEAFAAAFNEAVAQQRKEG